jgi:hypothetical protein
LRAKEALESSAIALQADVGDWPAVQGIIEKVLGISAISASYG